MRYGNKPFYMKIAASPLALFAALIVLGFLGKAAWNIYTKASTSSRMLSEGQAEFTKLRENQGDLSAKVAYLSTEQGVEAEMRSKFKAVKDGESVAVIVDSPQSAAAANASTTEAVGWWGRMLRFFGL